MMQSIRRSLLYFASAVALCFSGLGFAAEPAPMHYVRMVVADQGSYGFECAKVKAELAYMAQPSTADTGVGAGLTPESNGFRLTSMAVREVAGGMTGSTGAVSV